MLHKNHIYFILNTKYANGVPLSQVVNYPCHAWCLLVVSSETRCTVSYSGKDDYIPALFFGCIRAVVLFALLLGRSDRTVHPGVLRKKLIERTLPFPVERNQF